MPRGIPNNPKETRAAAKPKTREAMALFLNMDIVPPEMRPKGRGAAGKSIKVTVVKQTAKVIELQHTLPKKGRAKQTLQITATFPIEAVVLYEVEAVDASLAPAAPTPRKAPATKKAAKKKAAPKKKAAAKKKAAKKKAPAKKRAAKKRAIKKTDEAPVKKTRKKSKKRKGRKSLDDAPSSAPAKKVKKKKGKKGKKTRFGSSRRKSSFKLDPEDD